MRGNYLFLPSLLTLGLLVACTSLGNSDTIAPTAVNQPNTTLFPPTAMPDSSPNTPRETTPRETTPRETTPRETTPRETEETAVDLPTALPSQSQETPYSYEGVSLRYTPDLAQSLSGQKVAALSGLYGFGVDGPPLFYTGVPDFLLLTLQNEIVAERPSLLIIQPIREPGGGYYPAYPDYDQSRFDQLAAQLQAGSSPVPNPDLLPTAQMMPLSFQNGAGLRQIRHIPGGLGLADINNRNIFYNFEGFTADGRYYIWFQFPVRTTILSDEPMALAELEALYSGESGYNTYIAEKFAQLDGLTAVGPAAGYTPNLNTLDAFINSLLIPAEASTQTSLPINDPNCLNDADFVADVTIPDGSLITARQQFDKTWRLRNSGTCIWTAAYDLIPSGSSALQQIYTNSPYRRLLSAVPPGEELELTVTLLAPALAGTYRADWQLHEPFDTLSGSFPEGFGPQIYVEITVPENGQTDPPPQGSWQIYSYAFGPVAAEGEAFANAQVSKIVILAADSIRFDNETCTGVSYASYYIDPADYLATAYQTIPETLYITHEDVELITTGCTIPGLGELLRLSALGNQTLIFNQEGIFYFLYPQLP